MRLLLLISTFLLFSTSLSAQRENANWHFGCFAGINFAEDGTVSRIPSRLQSREGTASISDKIGKLLFYTDGRTIFNARDEVTVTGLYGHSSSTTSVISFPVYG